MCPSPWIDVLVIDDDGDCRRLVRDALLSGPMPIHLHEVTNGMEGLDFLYRRGRYPDAPRPRLIYLDLEMPLINGLDVLRTIKSDPELREIPAVMMTGLEDRYHRLRAAQHGVDSYVVKPVDPQDFLQAVVVTSRYWLHPGRRSHAAKSVRSGHAASRRGRQ